eukprot:TRINITY_DN2353_c0_g1_i1.p1 TRINITY_DN2353_c0_g1~~TRINITY_DN2353_c0_g1_i1.p1  ORF type:complete len:1007 (-),score=130.51 TRINITY_DN2353_c0_g1_i1:159-3179(-)
MNVKGRAISLKTFRNRENLTQSGPSPPQRGVSMENLNTLSSIRRGTVSDGAASEPSKPGMTAVQEEVSGLQDALDLVLREDLEGLMELGKTVGFSALVKHKDHRGNTMLHHLAEKGSHTIISCLLINLEDKNDNTVNTGDKNGWTPLHVACDKGHLTIVKLFLSLQCCDPKAITSDGCPPLHYLIRHLPNPVQRSSAGRVSINMSNSSFSDNGLAGSNSGRSGSVDRNMHFTKFASLCDELVDSGIDLNKANIRGETVLHKAVAVCGAEVVRWMLTNPKWKLNINMINKNGETALHIAARGKKDTALVLLKQGIDKEIVGNHGKAIDVARQCDQQEIVELLSETVECDEPQIDTWKTSADPRRRTRDGEDAIGDDYKNIVADVKRLGPDEVFNKSDATGNTLIHNLCAKGRYQLLLSLLLNFNGINMRSQNRAGCTPLHVAAMASFASRGQLRIIDLLLQSRLSSPLFKADDGSTAFHCFVQNFYDGNNGAELSLYTLTGKVFLIPRRKGDGTDLLTNQTVAGEYPLHFACSAGKMHAVKWLLSKGASVNATTKKGDTGLHLAIQNKHIAVVRVLVEHSADPGIANVAGITPLQMALSQKNDEMIEILANAQPLLPSSKFKKSAGMPDKVAKELKKMEKKRSKEAKRKLKESKSARKSGAIIPDKKESGDKNKSGGTSPHFDSGTTINAPRKVPEAHTMARRGDWESLERIIKDRGLHQVMRDTDSRGQTVLHVLIDIKDQALVAKFLNLYQDRLEPDLNIQDNDGWSALHLAAGIGAVDILLLLLSGRRFDGTLLSKDGSTPIHYLMRRFPDTQPGYVPSNSLPGSLNSDGPHLSAKTDSITPRYRGFSDAIPRELLPWCEAVGRLVYAGANIRATNQNGESVLHSAAMAGSTAAISWLVDNDEWSVDKNATTRHGETCLHLAARSGNLGCVRLLLEIGVNDEIQGSSGTAYEVAEEAGQDEVIELLEASKQAEKPRKRKGTINVASLCDEIDDLFDAALITREK